MYAIVAVLIAAVAVLGFSVCTTKTTSTNELVVEPRDDSHDKQENIPSDLPMLNGLFVGRENQVNEIVRYLKSESVNIVSIYGPPAFGKSTLAIHVGYKMVESGVPVRYIDMTESMFALFGRSTRSWKDQSLIPHTVTQVGAKLDEHKFPSYADWAELLNWAKLIKNHTVLLLDNCDQILHERKDEFHHVIQLMQQFSQNKMQIIVTSQERNKFLEVSHSTSVSELSPNASVKLLQELTHNQVATAEAKELASLVGNCPLALKVTAMLLREHSSNASRLARKLKRAPLSTISDQGLPKAKRFTAVMDIAYNFLDKKFHNCSHYLSLFPGSFDSEAGVNVLKLCGVPSQSECLDVLLWRSLIEEYVHGNDSRFKFHKLIKTYFIEKESTIQINRLFGKMFNNSFRTHYSEYLTTFAQHIPNTEAEIYKFRSEVHNVQLLLQILLDNQLRSRAEAATLAFAYHERMLPESHNVYRKMFDTMYPSKRFYFICNVLGRKCCASVFINVLHNLYLSTCINESHSCEVFSCDHLYNISHRIKELRTTIGNSSEAASVIRLIDFDSSRCGRYKFSYHTVAIILFLFTLISIITTNIHTFVVGQKCSNTSVAFANGLMLFFIVLYCTDVNLEWFYIIASLILTLPILLYNSFVCKTSQFLFLCLDYASSSAWTWITPSLMFLLTVFHVAKRTRNPLYIILCFFSSCSLPLLWLRGINYCISFILCFGIPIVLFYGLKFNVLNEAEMYVLHLSLKSLILSRLVYFRSWFIMYVDVNIYAHITLFCIFVFRQQLTATFFVFYNL